MRCNNNQCRHHDGIERCGNTEAVIISSIGQCLLMFDQAVPLELPEAPTNSHAHVKQSFTIVEKPRRVVTQDELLQKISQLGGAVTIRHLQRAFRVYCSDSKQAIDDCNLIVAAKLGKWVMIDRKTGGRPTTYLVLNGCEPPSDSTEDVIRKTTPPAADRPWVLTTDMVIAWLRSKNGYATAGQIRQRWEKSGCTLSHVDQVVKQIVAAGHGAIVSVAFVTGPRREYLVLTGFQPPKAKPTRGHMVRHVHDSDVVEWMQERNGMASIKDARQRFKHLRQPGTSPRTVFDRLVAKGLARWEIPPAALTGNRAAPVCILTGFPAPAEWVKAREDGDADDLSPFKENWQSDHPLATPTDLPPGSAEKLRLMQARIAEGLPATIPGDRSSLCVGSLD